MTDILDTIDQALGCQQCGESLDASPSDMYCSEDCSEDAAAEITCREVGDSWAPLDWSIDDAPEGPFSWLPAPVYDWRLPRSTGDLDDDITRWSYAQSIATTDSQRAACVERGMDLTRRLNERARERDHRAAAATVGFARSVGTEPLTRVEEWDAAFRVSELTDLEFSQFVGEPSGYMRAEFSAAFARSGGFVLQGRCVPRPRVQLNFEGLELTEEERREIPRVLGNNCQVGGRVTILRRNLGHSEVTDTNLGTWMVTGISRDEHTITYIGERVCAPT